MDNQSDAAMLDDSQRLEPQQLDAPSPRLDGAKLFDELKTRKIHQGFANLCLGLEGGNTSHHTPQWLKALSSLPARARHPSSLLISPKSSHLEEPCASSLPKIKQFSATPPRLINIFESHHRPPQYTWCGLLDRNAYPKEPMAPPAETLELDTIRIVPYYEVDDQKRFLSPAERLDELKKTANEAQWKICLDGQICPDVLRRNFYLLLAAFDLDSPERLCEMMKLPSKTPKRHRNSDDWFIKSLALAVSKETNSALDMVSNALSQAWTNLKNSGQLQQPKIPLRASGTDLTITGIIRNFRWTLPANRRLIFRDTAFRSLHSLSHQATLCAICKQFYCEGHYVRKAQRPVISTTKTLATQVNQTICGPNCSRERSVAWINERLEKFRKKKFINWDDRSKSLLRTIKEETGSQRDSACDLVFFFKNPPRPCWQIWAAWQEIAREDGSDGSHPNSKKPKTIEGHNVPAAATRGWMNLQPRVTDGYVPCWHTGPCSENTSCSCYRYKTACDRFCNCSPVCPRRYQGCACVKKCDNNCECIKKMRECDPLVCKCPTCDHVKPGHAPQFSLNVHSTFANNGAPAHNCGNFQVARRKKRTFVAPSKVAGLGLFAGERILSGDYFGDYTGVLVRAEELDVKAVLTSLSSQSYLFDLNKVDMIDAAQFGNRTRFINEPAEEQRHNASAHIWYVAGSQVIRFFADKRIEMGKEIFIDYGTEYEDLRDWRD